MYKLKLDKVATNSAYRVFQTTSFDPANVMHEKTCMIPILTYCTLLTRIVKYDVIKQIIYIFKYLHYTLLSLKMKLWYC